MTLHWVTCIDLAFFFKAIVMNQEGETFPPDLELCFLMKLEIRLIIPANTATQEEEPELVQMVCGQKKWFAQVSFLF